MSRHLSDQENVRILPAVGWRLRPHSKAARWFLRRSAHFHCIHHLSHIPYSVVADVNPRAAPKRLGTRCYPGISTSNNQCADHNTPLYFGSHTTPILVDQVCTFSFLFAVGVPPRRIDVEQQRQAKHVAQARWTASDGESQLLVSTGAAAAAGSRSRCDLVN